MVRDRLYARTRPSKGKAMQLSDSVTGDTQIIRVEARRIDAAVAIQFKDEVRARADRDVGRVILDLGEVEFLDSSGLGAVVAAYKQVAPGQTLELAALTPPVRRVFQLTRMDTIFTIHDRPEAALDGAPG